MESYHRKYYGQSVLWHQDYLLIPAERQRIEEVIKVIPPDAYDVLDVGCGNGAFVNTLVKLSQSDRFGRVVALDFSEEALKYVKTEKLAGNITNLPFEDESFDLVTCLEVLEHLGQEDFERGISEIQRVSRKYIIITVPNSQDLASSLVMCPKCCCWFSPYYHVRSFDKNTLSRQFTNFESIEIREIGPAAEERSYNRLLYALYRFCKKPAPGKNAICPQCGYQPKGEPGCLKNSVGSPGLSSSLLALFKPVVKLISPVKKKKRWLLASYERKKNR